MGGVAYCSKQHSRKKKVYCLLPLKMESDLKFHVNGHFALNYESRDCLLSGDEWNERVLRQIVAPCAVRLIRSEIEKVATPAKLCDAEKAIRCALDLLPGGSPQLEALRKGVFEILGTQDVKAFPVVQITDKVSCYDQEFMLIYTDIGMISITSFSGEETTAHDDDGNISLAHAS